MRRLILILALLSVASTAFAQTVNEDTPTRNNQPTFPISSKRCDTATASSGTDGDITWPCIDSSGKWWVNASGTSASVYLPIRLSDGSSFVSPAQDATAGSTALATGPQVMGDCDDTATVAGVENAAARMRVDCTSRALYTRVIDPCSATAKTYHVVNMSTATTVEIANAVSSQYFYICAVNLVAAAAQTVAIGEDDTDGCGSITAGLHGGATAATGWSFAANGGIALGNGSSTVMKTATAARYLCIITGQAAQISGTIAYVSAP